MNIKDFQHIEIPDGDMLLGMMQAQYQLEEKYRPMEAAKGHFPTIPDPSAFPVDVNNEHAQLLIKDAMERVIEELMEAANTLKNKPWKNTHVDTDELHFLEELADAEHFFHRLWLIVGGTPEIAAELRTRLYWQKHNVNQFRQETNY